MKFQWYFMFKGNELEMTVARVLRDRDFEKTKKKQKYTSES